MSDLWNPKLRLHPPERKAVLDPQKGIVGTRGFPLIVSGKTQFQVTPHHIPRQTIHLDSVTSEWVLLLFCSERGNVFYWNTVSIVGWMYWRGFMAMGEPDQAELADVVWESLWKSLTLHLHFHHVFDVCMSVDCSVDLIITLNTQNLHVQWNYNVVTIGIVMWLLGSCYLHVKCTCNIDPIGIAMLLNGN